MVVGVPLSTDETALEATLTPLLAALPAALAALLAALPALLATLNARERMVVTDRIGLGGQTCTLRELGARLEVSAERVRQIEAATLDKLWVLATATHESRGPATQRELRVLPAVRDASRVPGHRAADDRVQTSA